MADVTLTITLPDIRRRWVFSDPAKAGVKSGLTFNPSGNVF
jgi:hypothetical protein